MSQMKSRKELQAAFDSACGELYQADRKKAKAEEAVRKAQALFREAERAYNAAEAFAADASLVLEDAIAAGRL